MKQYLIAIFPLAILVLVFPNALPGGNFSVTQALLIAAISAAMYGVFLLIQTKTHQSLLSMSMKMRAMMATRIMANPLPTAASGIPAG